MKLDITDQEKQQISDALALAITSAGRAQKGRAPQISAVYKLVETDLTSLKLKVDTAK